MNNAKLITKREYTGIDFFKLIAAVLVVLLHAVENDDWYANEIRFVFTRLAVPFFFIASGFFFQQGLCYAKNRRAYFLKYEKKLLMLYTIWALIIYMPFQIRGYLVLYPDTNTIKMSLILFRRFFVVGPGPFWYLLAMILSSIILYYVTKKNNRCLIILIIIGLFLNISYSSFRGVFSACFVFDYLFKIVDFLYSSGDNFFMAGIPFMGIGFLFSCYQSILPKKSFISKRNIVILLIISTLLRLFEYNLPVLFDNSALFAANTISLAYIFQAVFFFMLAKEVELNVDLKAAKTFRQLSSFIYFSHDIILYELLDPFLAKHTGWHVHESKYILIKVIIVLAICVTLFIVIKKVNNKRLNILING